MIKIIFKSDGFSLIEAMISVMLVAILIMGVMAMITAFPSSTNNDFIRTCLLQAASSGIEAKRANHTLTSLSVHCGGITVNVTISGNPPSSAPPPGSGSSACATVTATASYSGRSMTLRDLVCNFSN
ncbi:MAG: hypothetical protein QXN68_03415 [Thermoplasmata archaeon]